MKTSARKLIREKKKEKKEEENKENAMQASKSWVIVKIPIHIL